jgi:putative membrane protein
MGEQGSARGVARQVFTALFKGGQPPADKILLTLAAFAALLLVMRLISMIWAPIRLHGFTLSRAGEDLRTQFGLLTRVSATIPLRRVQTVTIREGPLHRLFRRASVKVDTAGGGGLAAGGGGLEAGAVRQREALAPLVRAAALPRLLRDVAPEVDLERAVWLPAPARAFRRALKGSLIVTGVIAAALARPLGWWDLGLLGALVAWSCVHARLYVKHLGYAVGEGAILFRSGWLWRHVTIARFAKIQAVALHESPFDRRARMARLHVDTAGAGELSHRVQIPYLERADADALYARLSARAAETAFRW